jgi:hypothetical protein
MISIKYVILSIIYIIEYYFIQYHDNDKTSNYSIFRNPHLILFVTTFIFFYVFKSYDNNKCTKNKLENKYIISQSILYGIIALSSHNLYKFFIEKECIHQINKFIIDLSNTTYIPEGLFVSGIVLLSNQLSYLIYPKCS